MKELNVNEQFYTAGALIINHNYVKYQISQNVILRNARNFVGLTDRDKQIAAIRIATKRRSWENGDTISLILKFN